MAETSKQPLVSIIMSMWNVSATVRDTIRSLQWQTLGDWELVLFDDGSTDDSIAIVESIADSRIRLQSDGQRRGTGGASQSGGGIGARTFHCAHGCR